MKKFRTLTHHHKKRFFQANFLIAVLLLQSVGWSMPEFGTVVFDFAASIRIDLDLPTEDYFGDKETLSHLTPCSLATIGEVAECHDNSFVCQPPSPGLLDLSATHVFLASHATIINSKTNHWLSFSHQPPVPPPKA